MNNFKSYYELINSAKSKNRKKGKEIYYELHHIVPAFMGGDNAQENLVLLTLQEHVLAHYLLALENEKINRKFYCGNIYAAWLIINGTGKTNKNKILEIQEWLKDEKAQKLTEELKIRLAVVAKENLSRASAESRNKDRIWVQKINSCQKPLHRLRKNLPENYKELYAEIECCPICSKENSCYSFACCKEHEKEHLKNLRLNIKKNCSKTSKNIWKNPNTREKIISSKTGKKYENFSGTWITNDKENLRIKPEELQKYELAGWRKGRNFNLFKHDYKNMAWINKDGKSKRVKQIELESYLNSGWVQGRSNYTTKKAIYPKMAWVCNETEVLRIRTEKLEEYLKSGYIVGRTWKK